MDQRDGSRCWSAVSFPSIPSIPSAIGRPATFAILAGLSLATVGFTLWKVPETRGRSLAEIEGEVGVAPAERAA